MLAAPARVPEPILAQLSTEARAILQEGLGEMLTGRGLEAVGATREDTASFLAAERRKWASIAQRAEVRIE
ncbi:hypothetical protein ACFQU2_01575 [Siccirubricoccus deserti]